MSFRGRQTPVGFVQERAVDTETLTFALEKVIQPIVLPIVLGTVVTFMGAVMFWQHQRKDKAADDKKKRAALFHLFSLNAVRQLRRFAQYVGQGLHGALSFSRPFEPMTMAQLQKLAELGAPHDTLSTLYLVRSLNEQVTVIVDRAQREFSKMATSNFPNSGGPAAQTFGTTVAFIVPEWDKLIAGIPGLLNAAEADGVNVAPLRAEFKDAVSEYDKVIADYKLAVAAVEAAKPPALKTEPKGNGAPVPARTAQ